MSNTKLVNKNMADYKTHVRGSTLAGIVYGGAIWFLDIPAPTCALVGGICAMAGMLPDIDSKSSRSLRECLYIASGLTAMLTINRLREFPISNEIILLVGAIAFLFVRYVIGDFVRLFTVHRGLMHSIPAALIGGELVFLLSSGPVSFRLLKAGGLTLGYFSHLILDEIYSIDARGMRLKKSFGTALKFTDETSVLKTFGIYAILITIAYCAIYEPAWTEPLKNQTKKWGEYGTDMLSKYSDQSYTNNVHQKDWENGFQLFMLASNDPFFATWLNGNYQDDKKNNSESDQNLPFEENSPRRDNDDYVENQKIDSPEIENGSAKLRMFRKRTSLSASVSADKTQNDSDPAQTIRPFLAPPNAFDSSRSTVQHDPMLKPPVLNPHRTGKQQEEQVALALPLRNETLPPLGAHDLENNSRSSAVMQYGSVPPVISIPNEGFPGSLRPKPTASRKLFLSPAPPLPVR